MLISREVEIQSRRDRVLQLASSGLTQTEIATNLNYSQQTISNDLAYLRRKATENIAKYTEGIAFQHAKVKANLELIIREGWQLYQRITDNKLKVMLFNTLKDVNESLLQVDAVGDIIRQEMMES